MVSVTSLVLADFDNIKYMVGHLSVYHDFYY